LRSIVIAYCCGIPLAARVAGAEEWLFLAIGGEGEGDK
jgi:hypothetical protein